MRLPAAWTAAAVSGLVLGAVTMAVPAKAQDDGKSVDQRIFGSILSTLGLQSPDEAPGIDYRERAPLVIPPTTSLPKPEDAQASVTNPAWPKDPDITRRKEAAKRERKRNISDEREREQNPLRPDQLGPNVGPSGRDDGYVSPANGAANPLKPSELGYTGGLLTKMFGGGNSEVKRFTGEPARSDLTEPPPGYQTPSPAQPYGPEQAAATPKPTNDYVTRGELVR